MLLILSAALSAACLSLCPSQEASAEPRARTMVIHVEGGTVLRARAREVEGGWEVFRDGDWQLVPGERIERVKPEYDLLQEAQRLERALPRGETVPRVAYADWLVSQGLHAEALKALDRVLEADPDQADARALLARSRIRIALPAPAGGAGLEPYFSAAARLEGAARELAVTQLAAAPAEIPGLRASLANELGSKSNGRRSFATLALRRMFPGSEAKGLLSRAVLDSSDEVRAGAALALRDFEDPGVIAPVLRAMSSQHTEVRSNAVTALGRMEYREAVEPLYLHLVSLQSAGGGFAPHRHIFNGRQISYVQDFDVEVAQNEAIADPIINVLIEGSVLDVAVIGATEIQFASERAAIRRALAKLTGANPGETTVAWQRWWQEHGEGWKVDRPESQAPVTPSGRG